jgi:hypothetical protein
VSAQLKHADDDGDLSIFVSGNQILIACNNGHAWTARLSIEPDVAPRRRRKPIERGARLRAVAPDDQPEPHECDCDGDAPELAAGGAGQ